MKNINKFLYERGPAKVTYQVAFSNCKDNSGLPVSAQILIDQENVKEFEKYLADNEGEIFAHAEGGSIEQY